jgi:hypothetical protein
MPSCTGEGATGSLGAAELVTVVRMVLDGFCGVAGEVTIGEEGLGPFHSTQYSC